MIPAVGDRITWQVPTAAGTWLWTPNCCYYTSTIYVDWQPVGVSINNYSKFSGLILQLFSALGATIKSRTLVQATVLSVSYFIGKTTEVICSWMGDVNDIFAICKAEFYGSWRRRNERCLFSVWWVPVAEYMSQNMFLFVCFFALKESIYLANEQAYLTRDL